MGNKLLSSLPRPPLVTRDFLVKHQCLMQYGFPIVHQAPPLNSYISLPLFSHTGCQDSYIRALREIDTALLFSDEYLTSTVDA